MIQTIKKINNVKEKSYSPKRPKIVDMIESSCTEKIIDTVVIDGVEFAIIEKAKTIYAGGYSVAPDLLSDPKDNTWQWFQDNHNKIVNSITPNNMICLSFNYRTPDNERTIPKAMLHGQETTNIHQPEGVHVVEAAPTLRIKVKATDDAWNLTKKLTGQDNPIHHMAPLFGLISHIFIKSGKYEYNGNNFTGNTCAEYYSYNGAPICANYAGAHESYVMLPVKIKK